jgi:hypothetical protein
VLQRDLVSHFGGVNGHRNLVRVATEGVGQAALEGVHVSHR